MKYKLSYSPEFRAEIIDSVGRTRLILGSNSPRRAEILRMLGLDFEKIVPHIDENIENGEMPADYARKLALRKALAVKAEGAGVIIAADTIVVLGEKIINKPENREEARKMLEELSGRIHSVITAVALRKTGSEKAVYGNSESKVRFHELSMETILNYIDSGEPFGKAGAYAIQGRGGALVQSYQGELDTIIGFPAMLFRDLIKELKSEV
ncbi:MAG: septum formation protein Maf [candidate division Zixibacteria bacterium]|nr:septum formation protein Maf [candidate division Zixibacteria bacterium]NIR67926.1 septum formation protein Maf [candidate division Zixibacteria bacterium]NIS16289.1 septum formation protein Maf [candidate division Zixibacteria bacterium]NIS49143.1 septum formation protein Maf [candidate division Zixibacteria bacterium]NIT53651.1 septum formation protein Maf [candidate division Zixibacteria bacterium]